MNELKLLLQSTDKKTLNTHRKGDGSTLLQRAANEGLVEIVEQLLKLGSDTEAIDNQGLNVFIGQ